MSRTKYELLDAIESAGEEASDLSVMLGAIWHQLDKAGLTQLARQWQQVWHTNHDLIDALNAMPDQLKEFGIERKAD